MLTVLDDAPGPGAKAMLGFAKQFREPRRTADWMDDLREGERFQGLITRNRDDFTAVFPDMTIRVP